jgi:hypothetical protein
MCNKEWDDMSAATKKRRIEHAQHLLDLMNEALATPADIRAADQ